MKPTLSILHQAIKFDGLFLKIIRRKQFLSNFRNVILELHQLCGEMQGHSNFIMYVDLRIQNQPTFVHWR